MTTTSVPNGPLAKFLLNPKGVSSRAGADVQRAVESGVHWLLLGMLVLGILFVAVTTCRRRRDARLCEDARLIDIALPLEVDPNGALSFWINLHDILRPAWHRFWLGQPHLSFEMVWHGLRCDFDCGFHEQFRSAWWSEHWSQHGQVLLPHVLNKPMTLTR